MQDNCERPRTTQSVADRTSERDHFDVVGRDKSSFLWLKQLIPDVRYGVRGLLRGKMFSATAMITLALGIGANAGIFSIVNTVLLHPLNYPDADRLVAITSHSAQSAITIVSFTKLMLMQPQVESTQVESTQVESVERIGAYYPLAMNLTTKGAPEQVAGAHGSVDFFRTLGVSPALGRGFLEEEDQPGGREVALISDSFWHTHMGAAPDVIGKSISIDGRSVTIVGVLPSGFRFPFAPLEPQVWLPRVFENPNYSLERVRGGVAYLFLIGKLRHGRDLERARAELATVDDRYKQAFPRFPDASMSLAVETLESSLVANIRPSLLALLVAVGFVLLIACVNVANLLLARANSRGKEIGIRRALGASRSRLIRQLLTESLVLSFLGGGLGVSVAAVCLSPLMRLLAPGTIPLSGLVRVDGAVLLFSLATCIVTGVIFGLAPALQASARNLNDKLKQAGRGSTVGGRWARQWMVVSQVALTLMLMSGAGLLIRSVVNLMNVNPGFVSQNVLTFYVSLPGTQYPRPTQRSDFYRELVERTRVLPGVESAAVVSHLPLDGGARFVYICPEGTTCQGVGKDPLAAWRQVSPEFFHAMRIPMLHGRVFDERDRADSPPVVIINQTIADRYFPGASPIGRHIAISRDMSRMEIVGVVHDVKFIALTAPNAEEFYVPYTQNPWSSMTLVVRSGLPAALVNEVSQVVSRMDPDLPVAHILSLDQVVSGSVAQPRLIAGMVAAFALSAMFLAAVGIYGLMANLVAQRSAEIAIRMALGAQPSAIFLLVAGVGMKPVIAGLVLGVAMTTAVTRLLSSLLFGTSPTDLVTITGVSVLLAIVAFGACYIPSRRATRLDPIETLRSA